jgi:hypothetical protein
MLAGACALTVRGIVTCVRKVIHTGVLRTAVFRCVSKAEGVRNFLADDMKFHVPIIVFRHIKIRVVQLGQSLSNVVVSYVDLSKPEPAIAAVLGIADLCRANDHRTGFPCCSHNDRS